MCPILASSGSSGILSLQSCLDYTLEPFGIVTVNGFRAGIISTTGASVTRKVPVAPESTIAQSLRSIWLKSTVRKRFCTYGVALHPK